MQVQDMAVQDQNICWDSKMKADAMGYTWEIAQKVRKYLSHAIEYANNSKNEPPELFWKYLFSPQVKYGAGSIMNPAEGDPDKCPPNPYRALDVQALCKFLCYGDKRQLPAGVKDDSQNYYQTFRITDLQDKKAYQNVISKAITIRNKRHGHVTDQREENLTRKDLDHVINIYQQVTKPLERSKLPWRPENLEDVAAYWRNLELEVQRRFGAAPLSLEEIGQELFETEQLTPNEWEELNHIAKLLNLEIENGKIYKQPNPAELLGTMRLLRQGKNNSEVTPEAVQTIKEQLRQEMQAKEAMIHQVEEQEANLTAPLWSPIPESSGRILRQAGTLLHGSEKLWQLLLDSFQLIVDESLFLAPEGRDLLVKLQPVLAARHATLPVDASVVGTLFRQLRSSVPYTALELAEMEPDSREAMQQLRQELHQEAKTAIKVLRHLRTHRCLEVVASPTDSRNSYENIAWLARQFPKTRFLVLTLDRQLAEELSQVKGRNAVAAKPGLDGTLFLFRATRSIYQDMLHPQPEAQPSSGPAGQPEAAAAPGAGENVRPDTVLPLHKLPVQGEMVVAEAADGTTQNLRLGKFLNRGGEGSIYLTSQEEQVAKIYLPKHLTRQRLDKLKHMVAADPKISGLCWPNALLYNSLGEWIGFLMPKAEGKELATTVFTPGRGCCNIKAMGWDRRHLVTVAGNIAALFAEMHKQGILMGDVNPRNFMVQPNCMVYFVDCDSYQFDDFSCPVFSPLFLPPEIHERMRATPGGGSSSFIRTRENELYSIAVLLFEVMFLGKAPYESRNTNNDDVIQAIMDGNFPYPYKGNDEEEAENTRSAMLAPVGRWRNIWSHLPYFVKTGFYNAFTKKNRLSAAGWAQTMWDYRDLIEQGKTSNELLPTTYKVLVNQDGSEATKMVNLTCEQCGATFNQAEEVIRRRQKYGEKMLCDTCRNQRRNFERRAWTVTCDHCRREFQSNVAAWMDHESTGKPLYCPECVNATVKCSRCHQEYVENREKVNRLLEKGQPLLCPSCFQRVFLQVTCSECGTIYRDRVDSVEHMRRMGRPLLCPKCRSLRRA